MNLIAVAHYLEALEMQAKAAQVSALFGGRMPMTMTSPPGGVTHVPTVDDLKNYLFRVKELQDWIDSVFIADLLAIAPYLPRRCRRGQRSGELPLLGRVRGRILTIPKSGFLPRGAIFASDFPKVHDAKPEDVTEHTAHGWYKDGKPLNPAVGVTEPEYTGYDPNKKYTWAKAPRLQGKPMEVGALARMVVAYASGQPTAKKLIDDTLAKHRPSRPSRRCSSASSAGSPRGPWNARWSLTPCISGASTSSKTSRRAIRRSTPTTRSPTRPRASGSGKRRAAPLATGSM